MVTDAANCNRCGNPVLSGARFCQHCGADVSLEQGLVSTTPVGGSPRLSPQFTALDLLREETLGEYEIMAELGRGGMATVYLAHDIALGRRVAIKVMSPALVEEGVAERFRREARTAASLNHPHIIPIYTVRERPQLLYFVMKYIQGASLDPILKSTGWLPIPMVQLILSQAASALGYAHRRGVIHRDVKPANIMLDEDGWVVVTDFGIAKVSTATGLTMTGVTVGTPAYMSPEQCMGREVTGASDQYSLGVVAYQLITGQRPFSATSAMSMMYAHFNETPRPLRELRPDCPAELDEAVLRMLAKDAADRWPTIDEAFGGLHMSTDESTRTSLAALALSSGNARLPMEISIPTSPVPPARRAPGGSAPTVPMSPPPEVAPLAPRQDRGAAAHPAQAPAVSPRRSWPRQTGRQWAWFMTAFTTVAAFLVFVLVRQRGEPEPGGTGTGIAPPVADTAVPGGPIGARPDSIPGSALPPEVPPAGPAVAAAVAEVLLSPAKVTLEPGRTIRLRLELRAEGGSRIRDEHPVAWASSAPGVATVDTGGNIRGVKPGSTTITAVAAGKTGRARVDVASPSAQAAGPAPVASVTVTPADASVPVGGTITLSATRQDAKGALITDRPVTWSTTGPAATVSPDGVVTGVAPGTAVVRAESEGRLASVTITVTPAAVAEVRLVPAGDSLQVGRTLQLTATARDARGATLSDRKVDWASSDTEIASVSSGLVSARRPGTARISATVEGHTAQAQFTVLPVPVDPAVERARAAQEISRTLQQFVMALNGRSVAQLRQAYPGMSSAEESRWRSMLEEKSLVRLVASAEQMGDPQIEQDAAESRFRLQLQQTYSGRPVSNAQVDYRASFRREGGKWRLTRLQQQ